MVFGQERRFHTIQRRSGWLTSRQTRVGLCFGFGSFELALLAALQFCAALRSAQDYAALRSA
jgi:hypothetical protein